MGDTHRRLAALADEIESQMRQIGLWSGDLHVNPGEVRTAFGAGALSFEQWLQGVFLPRLREAAIRKQLPRASDVAPAAIRNLDGVEGVEPLLGLLGQVDALVGTGK